MSTDPGLSRFTLAGIGRRRPSRPRLMVVLFSALVLIVGACAPAAPTTPAPADTPAPVGTPAATPPGAGSPDPGTPDPGTPDPGTPDPGTPEPTAGGVDEPRQGGTFVMAVGIDIPEMDPHSLQTLANLQMYEAFFRRHPTEYGAFEPALAESMDISEDGLEITLNLRQGVTFHDGTPFNAEAAVFNLERQANPDHPFHQGGPFWSGWARGNPGVVSTIEAVDEHTVRLTLSEPVVDIEFVLADEHGMGMVSPAVIEADPEHFGQNPVGAGTGPFMFEERVPGDYVALVRNPDYWGDPPPLERWILRTMPDPGSRLLNLMRGDIHLFDVSGPEIAQLQDNPDLQLVTVPPIFGSFIAFNHDDPVTGNREVRQAISHAIDMDSIVSELSPFATVTPSFGLFPGLPGHREDLDWYDYDPDEARRLLGEAGYPDGVDLTLSFSTPPVGLNHQILAQALQGQMEAAGFRVQLEQVDGPTMFQSGFGPPGREDYPFQMALNVTGSDGNPFGMLAAWTSRSNYAHAHPEYLDLFFQSAREANTDARLELFSQMQQELYDDVGYIPLAHTEVVRAVGGNVRNIDTAAYHFRNVWLAED